MNKDKETAEMVSGLIMQGAAVIAYIIGEGSLITSQVYTHGAEQE